MPGEDEILLPPNTRLRVMDKADRGHGLCVVQLLEERCLDPILIFPEQPAYSASTPTLPAPPAVPPIPRPSYEHFIEYAEEGNTAQVTETKRYYLQEYNDLRNQATDRKFGPEELECCICFELVARQLGVNCRSRGHHFYCNICFGDQTLSQTSAESRGKFYASDCKVLCGYCFEPFSEAEVASICTAEVYAVYRGACNDFLEAEICRREQARHAWEIEQREKKISAPASAPKPAVPPIPRPSDEHFIGYAEEGNTAQVTEAKRYYLQEYNDLRNQVTDRKFGPAELECCICYELVARQLGVNCHSRGHHFYCNICFGDQTLSQTSAESRGKFYASDCKVLCGYCFEPFSEAEVASICTAEVYAVYRGACNDFLEAEICRREQARHA
eukprot:gene2419-biopygen2645